MKRFAPTFCAAVALGAAAVPCLAASPWDGTWKLNEAKSHMTGETMTITEAGGMYTMNDGAVSFKFACDGKDYTVLADRTLSCTGSGHSFTDTHKIAGKVISTTKMEISADGKTMTEVTTGTQPDGTAFTSHETDIRVGGAGTGLAGVWKDTKNSSSVPALVSLKVHDGMLRYEDVGYKDVSDAKLDGTPGPITGGRTPPGLMISNKAKGTNAVESVVTLNGKELGHDIMTISADGKTYTDVTWAPGKESEKRTYLYEKQ